MERETKPALLILNQMAGPLTWELAEDLGRNLGPVKLFTGHPDTLAKPWSPWVQVVPATPYSREGLARRGISWLRYLWQAFRWLGRQGDVPLLLFSNPPMLPWLGYLRRLLRGQTYVVMVHDIYPEVLVDLGKLSSRNPFIRLWHWLNRLAYRRAGVVMTLGECMAERLHTREGSPSAQENAVAVIHPWADTAVMRPRPKEENWFAQKYRQTGLLTVMYSGNMGLGHDLGTMLAAANRLQGEPDIHFMFIGAGPKWKLVEETISSQQLDNVTLLPWQPEETIPYSLACADVALVSLDPGAAGLAFPSKAIMFMAAGAALLGLSVPPNDLEMLIHRHRCGVNVRPGGAAGLAQAILRFRNEPALLQGCRTRARQAAEQVFAREVKVRELLGVIRPFLSLSGALETPRGGGHLQNRNAALQEAPKII